MTERPAALPAARSAVPASVSASVSEATGAGTATAQASGAEPTVPAGASGPVAACHRSDELPAVTGAGPTGDESLVTEQSLQAAVEILRQGGVIGLPTETVYGLAGNAADAAAVASIYRIKGRPADHPLIVHVAGIDEARDWAQWNPQAQRLAEAFWPGPLTLVLPRQPDAPAHACGGQSTIAVRVSSHPVFAALMQALRPHGITGLAAPSANRFGRISPSRAAHVRSDLGAAVPLVLEGGPARIGLESTIVDLSRGRPVVLRPGHIGEAQILAALQAPPAGTDAAQAAARPEAGVGRQPAVATAPGDDREAGGVAAAPETERADDQAPRVPGALPSHYAPGVPLRLVAEADLPIELAAARQAGEAVAVWADQAPPAQPGLFWRRRPADAEGAGRALYDTLHQLDALPVARILVMALPEGPAWHALSDRLQRAAAAS